MAEQICTKFTEQTCLVPRSGEFECQDQWPGFESRPGHFVFFVRPTFHFVLDYSFLIFHGSPISTTHSFPLLFHGSVTVSRVRVQQ